jgi:thiosulfate/3-mercaptopyruvate sulfurtransferase
MAEHTENVETAGTPFAEYAHPEKLVTTDWLAEQIEAGRVGTGAPDSVALLESDEDVLLYDTGHIPGALKLDWHQDLNDQLMRDYVAAEQFAEVLS